MLMVLMVLLLFKQNGVIAQNNSNGVEKAIKFIIKIVILCT